MVREVIYQPLDLCQPPFYLRDDELVLPRVVLEGDRLALREGSFRILQPYQCGVPPVAAIRQLVQFSTHGREPARVARAAQQQRFEITNNFMLRRRRRGEQSLPELKPPTSSAYGASTKPSSSARRVASSTLSFGTLTTEGGGLTAAQRASMASHDASGLFAFASIQASRWTRRQGTSSSAQGSQRHKSSCSGSSVSSSFGVGSSRRSSSLMSSQPSGFLRLRGGPRRRRGFRLLGRLCFFGHGCARAALVSQLRALQCGCSGLFCCCCTMQRDAAAIRSMRLVTDAAVCTILLYSGVRSSGVFASLASAAFRARRRLRLAPGANELGSCRALRGRGPRRASEASAQTSRDADDPRPIESLLSRLRRAPPLRTSGARQPERRAEAASKQPAAHASDARQPQRRDAITMDKSYGSGHAYTLLDDQDALTHQQKPQTVWQSLRSFFLKGSHKYEHRLLCGAPLVLLACIGYAYYFGLVTMRWTVLETSYMFAISVTTVGYGLPTES